LGGRIEKNQIGPGPFLGRVANAMIDARVGSDGQGIAIARQFEVPAGFRKMGETEEAPGPSVLRVRPAGINFGGLREALRGLVELALFFGVASIRVPLLALGPLRGA
jgi:hypothetical protein